MHVGYFTGSTAFNSRDPDGLRLSEELERAERVEALGFDSIWSPEHHFTDYSLTPNPVQILTYLAARTRRIKLGTAVVVLPWHDPVRVAEEISMLDHMSNGRVILGLGRGTARTEFEGFRI